MKRLAAIFMALLMILTITIPVQATEMETTTEHPKTTEYPNEPSREPDLVANAAIVMDVQSGKILYEKNAYERKYPASITKIMTTLLAIENNVNYDETISMTENAVWGIERDSTNIGLDVGEKVTIKDLLYATMVKSANECAYAIAEIVGGDIQNFADMMNEKASELGCQNTHFVTPNGLHDDNHYTCAYDMALITQEALKYDEFREIAGTQSYTIPPTNLTDESTELWNGNKMILPASEYYYEYCEGGKTGYTTVANNTLVTYSKKDDLELICVVLDVDGGAAYAYSDTKALYNYCYNNYSYYYPLSNFAFQSADASQTEEGVVSNTILSNYYSNLDHDMIDLEVDKSFRLLVNNYFDVTQIEQTTTLYDEVMDNTLGEITFTYDGEELGKTYITSSNPSLSSKMESKNQTTKNKSVWSVLLKILKIIGIILVSLIILLVLYIAVITIIKKRRRSQRRRNYAYRRRRRRHRRDDYYF